MDEKTEIKRIKKTPNEFRKNSIHIDNSKVIYMFLEKKGSVGKLEIGFKGAPLYIFKDIESLEQIFDKVKEQLVWQKEKHFIDYTDETFELIIDEASLDFVALIEEVDCWLLKIGLGERHIEFKSNYTALTPLKNRIRNALKQKMK